MQAGAFVDEAVAHRLNTQLGLAQPLGLLGAPSPTSPALLHTTLGTGLGIADLRGAAGGRAAPAWSVHGCWCHVLPSFRHGTWCCGVPPRGFVVCLHAC